MAQGGGSLIERDGAGGQKNPTLAADETPKKIPLEEVGGGGGGGWGGGGGGVATERLRGRGDFH